MKLQVFYQNQKIGDLAEDRRGRIFFEYNSAFLSTGINLSPLTLPLKAGAQLFDWSDFKGLFGLFYDSLPDQWGMGLLEEKLRRKGIQNSSPLMLLQYIGDRGIGALRYEPTQESDEKYHTINLLKTNREALKIVRGKIHQGIDEDLLNAGSSPGGARPKILIGINEKKGDFLIGNGAIPMGYSHWILKLQDGDKTPNAEWEYLYHLIAKKLGLRTVSTKLFPLASKKKASLFAIQRFDRNGSERIHYHSLCGIAHIPFSNSTDYDDFLNVTRELTHHQGEIEEVFKRAAFNLIGCVRDDHVKNHGYLFDGKHWRLSPVFDLLPSKWNGVHSLGYGGEHQNPTLRHLERLALYHSIPKAKSNAIIQKTVQLFSRIGKIAASSGVSSDSIDELQERLKTHLTRIQ